MPEIGLLPFARVARDVATAIVPTYRSRFSKHQFTQPQLLAILCLMRYEDWTFREAEVRLRAHAELRAVLRLSSVPDYSTVYRFLRRLPDDTIDSAWGESVRRLRRSSRRGRRRAGVAVDGTGLAPHAVSTYFLRRVEQHAGGKTRYRHFLKWRVVVDVDRQIILAQRARQGPWCDTRALPGLVDAASRTMPIGVVLADAEFDSEAHHRHVRGTLGAHSVIPNRRRGISEGAFRYQMHRAFPRPLYGPRAKIETVFSVIKRKLSTKAPGRSLPLQMRQALLLGLAFNLYRLKHRPAPAGCKQSHIKFNVIVSADSAVVTSAFFVGADSKRLSLLPVIPSSRTRMPAIRSSHRNDAFSCGLAEIENGERELSEHCLKYYNTPQIGRTAKPTRPSPG